MSSAPAIARDPAADGTRTQFTRLQLMRYSLSRTGAVQLDEKTTFEAQINPAEFSHTFGIQYDNSKAQGSPGKEPKFSNMDEERVSFSIVLDGTGVVPPAKGQPLDVKSQLARLDKVVYEYMDIKSEPPHVRVLWGTLIFFGRLQSLQSQYTLFKPSGDPLRAKVTLSFVGAMSKQEQSLVTSRISSSTRVVKVIQGDSLGALCEEVYGDSSGFLKVARYNGLTDFRDLPPGTVLRFPPREQLGQ